MDVHYNAAFRKLTVLKMYCVLVDNCSLCLFLKGCYGLLAEMWTKGNSATGLDYFQHVSKICVLDNKVWSYIHCYKNISGFCSRFGSV